jgi:hypothetical protein
MIRDDRTASRMVEIKRLLATGQYRIDPTAVADAMIRRGAWELHGYRSRPMIIRLPKRGRGAGS